MKTLSLLRKCVVILLVCSYAHTAGSQTPESPKVRGHVYDENNETLPRAIITLREAGPYYPVVSGENGYFEINARNTNDSILLKVDYLGYYPVEVKVLRDCEIDIHMKANPAFKDIFLGDPSPAPHREIRSGYIFDDKGKPVAGASIEIKKDGENGDKTTSSIADGSFVIRSYDFAELTISVEGHQPLKIDFQSLNKRNESELIKHDGLFIVIDFNW